MGVLQQLAQLLDRPLFPWKNLIVGFSVGQYAFETFLSLRQYRVLQHTKPPKALESEVSQEVFDKSQAYGRAKAKFSFINGLYGQATNMAVIYGDVLPKLWALSGFGLAKLAPEGFSGEISQSVFFFCIFSLITTVIGLPSEYYKTFVLEEKFGFNKQTKRLFFMDIVKALSLTFTLATPVLSGFLAIIQKTGDGFFYYLWLFSVVVQAFMLTIYPIAILPLFNKLSPLKEGPLKTGVEGLAKRLDFPLSELYVIDGSKRSAHSNAYFFGMPWKKHIVIYDTLIEKSEQQEIVAVLGHELGHWSLSHTTKLFGISQLHLFYIFTLFSVFIKNQSLYQSFGFHEEYPIVIGFVLFSDILAPFDTLVKFGMNVLSRKFEFEADAFATRLGYSSDLAKSLIKLQVQNLSTMDADWLYASYHFSHPILTERLGALGWKGDTKAAWKEEGKVLKAGDRDL
ncbi:MAG: hypothetical protein M1814_004915 [Vezdaea aestivalis]|nr:MAG: hypothetical protein M1814_004915 [Vezdaea aestivalis]